MTNENQFDWENKVRERRKVRVADLRQHPENKRIYSSNNIEQLSKCIGATGLMQHIIVNEQLEVYCGWRRKLAIELLGWTEIEVEIVNIPEDEVAAYIVSSNLHRVKTAVEIYREIKVMKSHWGKKTGQRTDLQPELSEVEKQHTRTRIAKTIGISETQAYRNEFVGEKDIKLLELVDAGHIDSLNEAYNACKPDKPKEAKSTEEIDLTAILPCPFCGSEWIFRTKCTGLFAAKCTTIVKCLI